MTPTSVRYYYIDFLKGIACAMMLVGHAFRIRMGAPSYPEMAFLYLIDFCGPIFFFMSGMNIMTFLERNREKEYFNATAFYMAAAAVLFFLGQCYNINRYSFGFMDIFQCVAACTAIVYLLMRSRLPVWAHFLIMAAGYGIYLSFRIRLEMNMILPDFTALRSQIPAGADVHNEAVRALLQELNRNIGWFKRMFFIHFSILPWITFFYMGALSYKNVNENPKAAVRWGVLFALLFLSGPFVGRQVFKTLYLDSYVDLSLRGIPSYVFMTLGGAGGLWLIARKYYKGAVNVKNRFIAWIAKQLEGLGKESFMFLVVHWWVLATIMGVNMAVELISESKFGVTYEMSISLRTLLTLVGTFVAVPLFARIRNWWSTKRYFGTQMALLIIFSIIVSGLFRRIFPPLSHYLSYGASFGFAFVYPSIRLRLRKKYTILPPANIEENLAPKEDSPA